MEKLKTAFNSLTPEKILKIVIVVAIIASLILAAMFYFKQYQASKEPAQVNSPVITLDTSGKLTIPDQKPVAEIKTQQTVIREIQYVDKVVDPITNQQEKTDVELNTSKKDVYVKMNGKEYKIQPTVEESQKFENGKLVVEEKNTSVIEIEAPKPSKWTATYLKGKDGHQGFGVGYAVSNTVRIDAMHINGDPYVGVTLSLGSLSSK